MQKSSFRESNGNERRLVMRKHMFGVVVMVVALAAAAQADTFTLKEHVEVGYTYSETADVTCEWSSKADKEYNKGGAPTISAGVFTGTSYYRVALVSFDLDAIPMGPGITGVKSVNSATLRVYQTSSGASSKAVQKMLESWEEGTSSGAWGATFDGASHYVRNAGTLTPKGNLTSYNHDGTTVYYIGGVTSLGDDQTEGGDANSDPTKRHYIREGNRNWEMYNRKFSRAADLDALAAAGASSDTYYYDDAADRLYVRRNSVNVRWFEEDDLWANYGPKESASVDPTMYPDITSPNPATGWYDFDVTDIAEDWLIDGDPNYGVRLVRNTAYGSSDLASSEHADSTLHPELVLDLEMARLVPEPAGLGLVGLALLALKRRRR